MKATACANAKQVVELTECNKSLKQSNRLTKNAIEK